MNELHDMRATFGKSEPVFKVSIDNNGDLSFDVINPYVVPMSDDPVFCLLAETYSETLDKHERRFVARLDDDRCYRTIFATVRQVVANASPLKNPKQGKLYKWLCEQEPVYHSPSCTGFIALYRYIIANMIGDTRDERNPYAMNVIAILEMMKEKHENK